MKKLLLAAAIFGAAFNVSANGAPVAPAVPPSPIVAEFQKLGVTVKQINPSPIAGLNEVITDKGVLYASDNGRYLLQGTLLDIPNRENLTDKALSVVRKEGVKQFADSAISYPAKDEKYKVTVFTDITCGYCRKLHRELEEYHKAGITIEYLAYPRSGIPSKGFDDLQNIWCASDAAKAMTDAKLGSEVARVAKCDAPVKEQYELGQSFGISGTPAIILEDGTLIPGYQPAASLKKILDDIKKG